jgi:hypothetical protein
MPPTHTLAKELGAAERAHAGLRSSSLKAR